MRLSDTQRHQLSNILSAIETRELAVYLMMIGIERLGNLIEIILENIQKIENEFIDEDI